MSEQMMDLDSIEGEENPVKQVITASDISWMSVQPVLVLGSMILVATMVASEWANHKLYAVIMIMLPIPVLLIAERFLAKRRDWLLKPAELWEDAFWYGMGIFLWGPIVSGYYSTPIRGLSCDSRPLPARYHCRTGDCQRSGTGCAPHQGPALSFLTTGFTGFNTNLYCFGGCMPPITTLLK